MPVRHRDLVDEIAPPQPKRCRHCDDQPIEASSCGSGGGGESEGSEGRESWRVTLDHDLVETLSAIYPEWFKPQQRRRQRSDTASLTSPASAPNTPPSDDALSWGGESSDMAGRQGSSSGSGGSEPASSPPRVSPPKVVVDDSPLQPAMDKHKESLKVKLMMRRPLNQLVAQGIMPPLKTPPAYFEQCKQLERAKTGDLLKAKIQRRPDRQELERRHILEQESHVDPSLAEKQRMLKKARLADQLNDQLSHRPGPLELIQKNILHTDETVETAVKSGTVAFKATCEGASHRPQHPIAYCGPPEDASPTPSPPSTLSPISVASPCQHPAPGKDKNRKKSKQKHQQQQQTKARFKFHEYKGPPSAQKASSPPGDDETPYELLLQQQQMLLQLMLPASPAPSTASDSSDALSVPPPPPPPPPVPPSRFEDMKVSDLRAECKRRNLRVSGPKPQLLDRLRPFLGGGNLSSVEERQVAMEVPMSPATMRGTPEPDFEPSRNEDIVVSQRRQIEELERKLEASRRQLEAVRRDAAGAAASDQSRRLLQAHLCVSQLRAQLDALQQPPPPPAPPATLPITLPALPQTRIVLAVTPPHRQDSETQIKQAPQTYILNGVKMVPIAILPTHYEAHPQVQVQQQQQQQRQETPPPPPPPPLPLSPLHGEESQIMDDVLEILVENGELPASAVSKNEDTQHIHTNEISLDGDYSNSNAAADLQRELDDLQHEILQNADCDTDLAVDLLSDDFHADFGESDPTTDHNFLGSLLGGPTEEEQSGEMSQAMDIEDQDRMCVTPLTNGDILDHGRTCFEDMDDLSLPSFNNDEHCDFDLKEFGIEIGEGVNVGMETEGFGCRDPPLIPNLFGRGHVPQCDPLLGGAAPRQHKHFSWDKFELDAT